MSELPRIQPTVPVPPIAPLRPTRETGREPRRPRPEPRPKKPGRRGHHPDDEPETGPDAPADDDRGREDVPLEEADPPPAGRVDLRV